MSIDHYRAAIGYFAAKLASTRRLYKQKTARKQEKIKCQAKFTLAPLCLFMVSECT